METSLTKAEQMILDGIQTDGTAGIESPEQIDLLIQGILKASELTYNSVIGAVKEDRLLCKAISKRMSELAEAVVEGNNVALQSVLDTYKANSEAIRQFMLDPTSSEMSISECFVQLRYFADAMYDLQNETKIANQKVTERAANTNEMILDRSKRDRDIVIGASLGVGGLAILYGCAKLIKEITKK